MMVLVGVYSVLLFGPHRCPCGVVVEEQDADDEATGVDGRAAVSFFLNT